MDADQGLAIILVSAGLCGFLLWAGKALYAHATRPRHEHKWKVFAKTNAYDDARDDLVAAVVITLQCETCGDITTRKVRS